MRTSAFGGTAVVAALAGAALGQPCGVAKWNEVSFGPRPRAGAASAFHAPSGQTLLFGGHAGGPFDTEIFGDTWLRTDGAWVQASVSGPSARTHAAAAFDAARGQIVLFGGQTESSLLGETWLWNGQEWQRALVPEPSPRWGASMAYDPSRQVVVLFGGRLANFVNSNEVWEWNGTGWTQRTPVGQLPLQRHFAAMAYDASVQQMLLQGGTQSGPGMSDLWRWNGSAWSMGQGPSWSRFGHAMVYEPAGGGQITVMGGSGTSGFMDVWTHNGTQWTNVFAPFGNRRHMAVATDTGRGRHVLFGGLAQFAGFFGETWERDWVTGAWENVPTGAPSPRAGPGIAYDRQRERIVLYGGTSIDNIPFQDTWEWDGAGWERVSTAGPTPRRHPAMGYDAARGRVVLFGGEGFSDTWEWDGIGWTQRLPAVSPPARGRGHMAFDTVRGHLLMFGGFGGTGPSNFGDLWAWDGETWSLLSSTALSPSPRSEGGFAFDEARGRAVLFGGVAYNVPAGPQNDTWEWDGAAWTQRPVAGPGYRFGFGMDYDAKRQRVVLVGGTTGPATFNDRWEWDGEAWAQCGSSSGPEPRRGFAFAYDRARGEFFLRGGMSTAGSLAHEQWALRIDAGCYANCDGSMGSPVLNLADFGCFLSKFAAGDPYANCDGSTEPPILNVADFGCFLNKFAAGCP